MIWVITIREKNIENDERSRQQSEIQIVHPFIDG